jgi:hypothetical protein
MPRLKHGFFFFFFIYFYHNKMRCVIWTSNIVVPGGQLFLLSLARKSISNKTKKMVGPTSKELSDNSFDVKITLLFIKLSFIYYKEKINWSIERKESNK